MVVCGRGEAGRSTVVRIDAEIREPRNAEVVAQTGALVSVFTDPSHVYLRVALAHSGRASEKHTVVLRNWVYWASESCVYAIIWIADLSCVTRVRPIKRSYVPVRHRHHQI